MSTHDQNQTDNQSALILALMQAAAKSAELRKRAALEGKEVRTNIEDAAHVPPAEIRNAALNAIGTTQPEGHITPGAPVHDKSDFMNSPFVQHLIELAEIQNRPTGTELKGEIEFLKEDYRNKKISIKIAVTDTETGDKQKSKINIGVNKNGSASFKGDTGLTEAETPLERASVVVFSTVVDALKDFVEELTSGDD
jgi:hypothetical protein